MSESSPMPPAMILAAGLGSRLRPLTDTIPKALAKVNGKALIDYALETLARSDVKRVVVNLHHHGDQIRRHLGNGSRFGLKVDFSPEETLLDSGGGIKQARELLGTERFITLNCDTIIDIDLAALLREHRNRRACATMVIRKDPQMEKFGLIGIEADGRIGAFLEHRRPRNDSKQAPKLDAYMYTGVQVLEPRVFDYMSDDKGPFSITRLTYPRMLAADEPIYGTVFDGSWVTVGTPEELEEANLRLG